MDLVVAFAQGVRDAPVRLAPVVREQVLDVLQDHVLGSMVVGDAKDLVEECPASGVRETRLLARDAERLAREPGAQDVERGDCFRIDFFDVSRWFGFVIEFVGVLGTPVYVAGKDAFATELGEARVERPDSAEEVDEGKGGHRLGIGGVCDDRPLRGSYFSPPCFQDVHDTIDVAV